MTVYILFVQNEHAVIHIAYYTFTRHIHKPSNNFCIFPNINKIYEEKRPPRPPAFSFAKIS